MQTAIEDPDDNDPKAETEDTKPEGYGTLGVTYEWVTLTPAGMRDQVRARCIPCGEIMTWTMKVDPRYGLTVSRHTRGPNSVGYNGKPVESWECPSCKQWVVK